MSPLSTIVARAQRAEADLTLYALGIAAGTLLTHLGGYPAAAAVIGVLLSGAYLLRQRDRRLRPRLEVDLHGCARCGGDHPVEFLELVEPIPDDDGAGTWAYWAPCPTLGEPILLRSTSTP
jgi:hypothetical protein